MKKTKWIASQAYGLLTSFPAENSRGKKRLLAICMAAMMVLLAAGCKNSSDGPDSVPVAEVTLNETALTLPVSGTATLKATVEPDDATDKTVTWSSSNEAFATVDENGKVTAVAEGTATITAKAGGKSATCEITVTSVAVNSVELDPKTLSLTVGETEELNVRILPAEASDVMVTYSSSNEAVATVDKDGKVTAAKAGTATITAKAGDKTATCEVSVNVHTHYYVNWKCQTCGQEKPSLDGGEIDNWGTLTKYTGNATTLVIPVGVSSIENSVFKDCTSLTKVTIPESVTEIKWGAFYGCTNLAEVTIPESVTKMGYYAFADCTSLKSVTIPGSVTSIEYAFKDCTSLTEVTIPGSVTNISSAFEGCTGLTSVTMDDGVKTIGYHAFKGCTSLASVTIPDSVTEIESRAFYGCTSLTSVTIPASVTKIGSIAFYECTSLKEIQFNGTKAQWNAIDGHIGVKDVPEYLKISGRTVTGHNGEVPANLVIPDGVTEIGKSAFYNCADIETVTIPGSVTAIKGLGTSSSDHGAFEGCANLKTVTMGDGVKTIGSSAFKGCTSLANVTIPDGVTEIGSSAFYKCTSLANVTIPASVTKIGMSAFESCTGLTSVTMDDGVAEIGYGAFEWCTSLASVTIPASVTKIGSMAFYYCSKLKTVNYTGTEEQWKNIAKDSSWAPAGTSYEIMYNYTE